MTIKVLLQTTIAPATESSAARRRGLLPVDMREM